MDKVVARTGLIIVFIIVLIILIAFSRGYRFDYNNGQITSTGILVVSSNPNGAKIYINGVLKNATNSNIGLAPGAYDIELKKESYHSYKKSVIIKGELVTKIDALMFPQNPSLSPITSLGVIKAFVSNDLAKIILLAQGNDSDKEGIYLLEASNHPLSLINPLKLLVDKSMFGFDFNFDNCDVIFSPTSKEFIFTIKDISQQNEIASYLIDTDVTKQTPYNITLSKNTIQTAYQEQKQITNQKILETFKDPLPKIASDSFKLISFSPDDTKILYQATQNDTIPLIINPPLIATNQTPEDRNIKKDSLYVYDKKEDKNYKIDFNGYNQEGRQIIWYPDSNHLIYLDKKQVLVSEYDGMGKTTVYSGPFEPNFITVSNDGKLLVLTNLNSQINIYPDVYLIGIR